MCKIVIFECKLTEKPLVFFLFEIPTSSDINHAKISKLKEENKKKVTHGVWMHHTPPREGSP